MDIGRNISAGYLRFDRSAPLPPPKITAERVQYVCCSELARDRSTPWREAFAIVYRRPCAADFESIIEAILSSERPEWLDE